jgi:hypothetical protein
MQYVQDRTKQRLATTLVGAIQAQNTDSEQVYRDDSHQLGLVCSFSSQWKHW